MDFTVMDIRRQINSMIYLNVMSYSVLSGCGNCAAPSIKDIEQLDKVLDTIPITRRPYNIFFTFSLYKKCIPQYESDMEDPYNFQSFKWISKKKKKIIDLKVMAASIISCCNLIERILTCDLQVENPNFITFILYKTAVNQAKFILRYLKVGDLFYQGKDVSEEEGGELHIQISPDNPDRVSQFAVLHAFWSLYQICSYNILGLDFHEDEIFENLDLLPGLAASLINDIEDCTSRELSQIGLHLTEICKIPEASSDICHKVLMMIAEVLCRRTLPGGDIARDKSGEELCSINTTANCLNLLSQIAYMFCSKACYDACQSIYDRLDSKWDEDHGIFKIEDSNKQSFSIKNVSSIFAALFSFLRIIEDPYLKEHIQRQISAFSEVVFIKSGIYNGQCLPILQQNKMEFHEALKFKQSWAPVFNKAFEYKLSKRKFYCDSDLFRADYVLPSCAVLLNCINN